MEKRRLYTGYWAALWVLLLVCLAATLSGNVQAAEIAEQTIFTDQIPDTFEMEYSQYCNYGVRFQAKRPGKLLGCRIYVCEDEWDDHQVRLWDAESKTLVLGPLNWRLGGDETGWVEFRFPEAFPIEAAHEYVMCVSNSLPYQGHPVGRSDGSSFARPICNRDLVTFVGSGVYDEDFSKIPTKTKGDTNFFRDVIFLPDEPYTAELDHIAVTRQPNQTEYFAGASFDPEGMEVTAFFTDGSRRLLLPGEYTLEPDAPLREADTTITITYEDQSTAVEITVFPVILSGILLSKLPDKLTYFAGECFDPSGMEVTALYNSGGVVVEDYTWSPDGPLTVENAAVTIMYNTVYTECAVQVLPPLDTLDSIVVSRLPDRVAYTAGEAFDPAGLEITACCGDGSRQVISDYTYAPSGPLTPENTAITVSYAGKTVTVAIQVANPPAPPLPEPPASTAESTPVISAESMEALLAQSGAELEIPVRTAGDEAVIEISADALQKAAAHRCKARFTTDFADLVVPAQTLQRLGRLGSPISFALKRVENAGISCIMAENGRKMERVPGGALLEIPLPEAPADTVAALSVPDGARRVARDSYIAGEMLRVPLCGSATVSVQRNGKAFKDASPSEAIAFVSSRELFRGVARSEFAPDAPMTRAMLAQVLHNLAGNPAADQSNFRDVPSAAWYAKAVSWAEHRGIARGSGGNFRADEPITKRDFLVMLWRYSGGEAPPGTPCDSAALPWAAAAGLFTGGEDPDGRLTRLEAAELIQKYMESGLHIRGLTEGICKA